MDKRTILICDNDPDHSFTLEGELRNHNYEVIIIREATELLPSAKSLHPSVVLINPDMKGFNEYDICKYLMREMHTPVVLMMDAHTTHRAMIDQCQPDDVVTKPVKAENLLNLIAKHITTNQP